VRRRAADPALTAAEQSHLHEAAMLVTTISRAHH
jgi:hypothetical protein